LCTGPVYSVIGGLSLSVNFTVKHREYGIITDSVMYDAVR